MREVSVQYNDILFPYTAGIYIDLRAADFKFRKKYHKSELT